MKETSYGKRVRRRLESELTAERTRAEQAEARLAEAVELIRYFKWLGSDSQTAIDRCDAFLSSTAPPPILAELNAVRAENQRLCDEISIITAPDDTGKVLLTKEQQRDKAIEVLKYAASLCDSKNLSFKNAGYRAACEDIKVCLLASIERLESGERMEAVATVCSDNTGKVSLTKEHPTLSGHWRHSNGMIFCGSLRIARGDFDTNPSLEFCARVFDDICANMNVGLTKEKHEELLRDKARMDWLARDCDAEITFYGRCTDANFIRTVIDEEMSVDAKGTTRASGPS